MRVRQIRVIIILGLMSLIGIVAIQIYWLFSTWHLQQEKLDENIWLALKQVTIEINELHDCQINDLNPVQQNSETCYTVDVSCNFNQPNLEHLIRTNFNQRNVNIEHEIAIFNCDVNQLEFIGKFSASGDKISEIGDLDICIDLEETELVYFFCINISGRNVYLFKKMQLWLILSLFVLIIIMFFAYAMFSFFKQKQLSELQKDFINNMTHEFKTPISSIGIASDVLLSEFSESVPERFTNYAKIIKQENARLNKQVENVLRAASIEKSKTIMDKQNLNLHNIINEVFSNHIFSYPHKNVNILKQLNASADTIYADKLHLTNILFNLLDNAIKYNDDKVELTISTFNKGSFLYLSVKDNGQGIPVKLKNKVFGKFYRVPTGNLHNVKGFGLGLYYVKQVCDSHNWKIEIETDENIGTKFTIKIKCL